MLNAKDRDWLQDHALAIREIEKRGKAWHGSKGLVLYLAGGFALMALGGSIFGNKETGTVGTSLAFIIALCAGGFCRCSPGPDNGRLEYCKLDRQGIAQISILATSASASTDV